MRLITVLSSLLLLVPLGGCPKIPGMGSDDGVQSGDGTVDQAETAVLFTAEPGLSARERYLKSLGLLEEGEAQHAKVELDAYMLEKPTSDRAKNLIEQIEADPVELLGEKSFSYTLQPGDSLSIVAKRFLGDPLKFYALARYNAIDRPKDISVGQTIKVPGDPSLAAVPPPPPKKEDTEVDAGGAVPETADETMDDGDQAEVATDQEGAEVSEQLTALPETVEPEPTPEPEIVETPESISPDNGTTGLEADYDKINAVMLAGQDRSDLDDYLGAANKYEEGLLNYPDNQQMKLLAAANYKKYADQLESEGHYGQAETHLRRAGELVPGDQDVATRVDGLVRLQKADASYRQGLELDKAGKPLESYDIIKAALLIAPDHQGANDVFPAIAKKAADNYYRTGLQQYHNQKLDDAEVSFKNVLEIDPSHTNAQLFLGQTLDLKERIKKIPEKQ